MIVITVAILIASVAIFAQESKMAACGQVKEKIK